MVDDRVIRAALLELAVARAPTPFCPSEVARALAAEWRPLMPDVRRVAAELADEGQMVATQKGAPVNAVAARWPIRLALKPDEG